MNAGSVHTTGLTTHVVGTYGDFGRAGEIVMALKPHTGTGGEAYP